MQAVNGTACAQDPAACSTAKQVVQVAMLIVIVMAVVLQTAYPSLGVLVNCKYVAQVATVRVLACLLFLFLLFTGHGLPGRGLSSALCAQTGRGLLTLQADRQGGAI